MLKNISVLIFCFEIITFALLIQSMGHTNPDLVGSLPISDDILQSKAAFAVVDEEIARLLNLGALSEWDYQKLRGPVLLKIRTAIHFQLREQFGRIFNTVDFGVHPGSSFPSQSPLINQNNRPPQLHKRAAKIIRDFITREQISVIIMSDASIGLGEAAAIRGLRGEVRHTYEIINGACVVVPIRNLTDLVKRPFISEIWPDAKVNLALTNSLAQIGAIEIHSARPTGLGVMGEGVNVAVVDGGIDSNHPEFKGRIKDTRGVLFGDGSNASKDEIDHGTHVAGIIGAALDNNVFTGVSPKVNLLDAQVDLKADSFFFQLLGDSSDAMDAIKWTAKKHRIFNTSSHADIINMSLGIVPWVYGQNGDDPMSQLIDKVVNDGIVFVVSAGNAAQQRDSGSILSDPNPNRYSSTTHEFSVGHSDGKGGSFQEIDVTVTLLWDTKTNNLDLTLLDLNNKIIASSATPTSSSKGNGDFYEEIMFTSKIANSQLYKLRVGASFNQVQTLQKYEVWGSNDRVRFHTPDSIQTVTVPGYSEKAITVGAVDSGNQVTNFSSQGPSDTSLMKPEIVAPGLNIYSTVSSPSYYDEQSGTSMAAPHVAGVAALILDAVGKNTDGEWNFSPDEVKSAIVRGAQRNIGGISNIPNNEHGAGLVKADNIIFSETVQPNESQKYEIKRLLTGSKFGTYILNADPSVKIAISWQEKTDNLDIVLADAQDKILLESKNTTTNYEKISGSHTPTQNALCYLYVQNKSQKPVIFTGASTHPIVKLNSISGFGPTSLQASVDKPSSETSTSSPSTNSTQNARLRATLKGHTDFVSSVAFSHNGSRLVSGSWDDSIRLWDTNTLETLAEGWHSHDVTSVTFSPDGLRIASSGRDEVIRIWNSNATAMASTYTSDYLGAFNCVVFIHYPDTDYYRVAAANELDGGIDYFNYYDGNTHLNSTWYGIGTHSTSSLAVSPDQRMIASGGAKWDTNVALWDPYNRKLLKTLKGHTDFITSVAFSPDSRTLASGSWDNTVLLWNIADGKLITTLRGHTDRVLAVAFSPDGRTLASGSDDQTIRLWDITTGRQKDTLLGHTSGVTSLAFNPNRITYMLASAGGWDNTVRLWDISPAPTSIPAVRISPSPIVSPDVGDNLTVKINISGVTDVAGYQATVHFDPTALRYVESANGTYLPSGSVFVPPVVSSNQVIVAAASLSDDSDGAGTLASLTFEVLAKKPSKITLSDVAIMKQDLTSIPIIVKSGDVVVQSAEVLDVNGDGIVNIQDLTVVATHFGKIGENQADVNADNVVDIKDLLLVAGGLNADAAAPLAYPQGVSILTAEEVEMWLSRSQQLDLNNVNYQKGIAILQQLLVALTPKETALLPNYPNPFNPETWIPYQLAKPADVTVTIYAVDGTVVRALPLGHQPIGTYQSKSRAAYWDGKNALGEPVASGVYFYTLKAGDFTATRKMLIRK